jgi:hypothetical protein
MWLLSIVLNVWLMGIYAFTLTSDDLCELMRCFGHFLLGLEVRLGAFLGRRIDRTRHDVLLEARRCMEIAQGRLGALARSRVERVGADQRNALFAKPNPHG